MSIWWWISAIFDVLAIAAGIAGVLVMVWSRRWEAAAPWMLAGLLWSALAAVTLFLAGWRW